LALMRPHAMSAIPPLLEHERTSRGDRESDVHDPKWTFRPSIIACQSWPRWVQESLIAQVLKKPATRDASFLMTRSLYCD